VTIDRRHIDIERTADDLDPGAVADDQMAVIFDNMICGYFRDPQQTDAMLRRDGLGMTADRLAEVFGPGWWKKL
jgi:hypothetical protein